MNVSTILDLLELRKKNGLTEVNINLQSLLKGNLPIYVIRYSLWSLRPGGRLNIIAPNTIDSPSLVPRTWSFQLVTQLIAKACQEIGEIVTCDVKSRRLICQRFSQAKNNIKWSAGIIYSGMLSEMQQMKRCVQTMLLQPELEDGGQVVVCGPPSTESHIAEFKNVEYLPIETQEVSGRFLIGRKKMELIKQMKNNKVLVCHTRIELGSSCLANLPSEFDIITPRVWVNGLKARLPYLDLGFFANSSAGMYSEISQPSISFDRQKWMEYLKMFYPYIDGGLFCVRRDLALQVPLSSEIAWAEAEDSEWCLRIINSGKAVELWLGSHAESATCKMPRYSRFGHLMIYKIFRRLKRFIDN